MASNIHNQLKTALKLENTSITDYANNLVKPDGSVGVSHSFVIAVAKGKSSMTPWLRDSIQKTIEDSRRKYHEYYRIKEQIEREAQLGREDQINA
ncbi:MAG: hypothetical protein LAT57_00225 [Balneolales bacterium]|nr:hypothetical protein [Balneolales bacterium]